VAIPTPDTPQNVDLQFMVGDAGNTFIDEEKTQSSYASTQPDKRSMMWQVGTINAEHNWKITKTVFVDPTRNSPIQRTTFTALNGKKVGDFNLYVLHKPAIDGDNYHEDGKVAGYDNRITLVTSGNPARGGSGGSGGSASALAVSLPWRLAGSTPMASVGAQGLSDGWTDLMADNAMDYAYSRVTNASVVEMGWIDLGCPSAISVSFDVVVGFGKTEKEAIDTASGTPHGDCRVVAMAALCACAHVRSQRS
jgi:glucoamylase